MSFLEKWTKRATKTAHETFKEVSAKDAAEKLDILEPIVEIAMMVFIAAAAIRGSKAAPVPIPQPQPMAQRPVDITLPISLIFRKEDL